MQRVLAVGVDYGTTNPTRGIKLGLGDDNRLYAMAEWAPGKGTTADRSKSLREFITTDTPDYLFVDPAAAEFKVQLQRDGFMNVANGMNKVSTGIGSCPRSCRPTSCSSTRRAPNCSARSPATCGTPRPHRRGRTRP
ncbi:hypothetical protein GS921_00015 [Rhodococcus hoagii]|nr:hypothetical protein [Prescottella equi]